MLVTGDKMKKLLFLTWSVSYGYGTEKSLADVLNRLDAAEYEMSVLPLFKNSESTIFKDHIKILEPLIDYTAADFDEQAALQQYYKLLANPLLFNKRIPEKYDCVIACNHNAPSYLASYIQGGAKILWIRGDMRELDYRQLDENSPQYKQVKQEYEMQARVLRSFDAIAVISDVVEQTLAELFGITEHVVRIQNSVDRAKILRLAEQPVELPEKKLFTTLGRLDYNKNQILLLKAAKEAKKEREDFMIYLLGEGEERQNLETYIEQNDLSENVRILGFVENPYPYMKNSVATVLTSLSEGFSLALVESVILNTPILSTNVGVAKELIEKYQCGDFVPYDENELAALLLLYMERYDGLRAGADAETSDLETDNRKQELSDAEEKMKPSSSDAEADMKQELSDAGSESGIKITVDTGKTSDGAVVRKVFDVGDAYDIETEVRRTRELIDATIERAGKRGRIRHLPYPEVTIREYELADHVIPTDQMYVLRVMKDGVPYEYLINRRSTSSKLVVFHNGAVAERDIRVPVFQRHSWAPLLKTSSVFCMDPTLYLNSYLQLGWGVGKNDNYYLENSSRILKELIAKMGIALEDTAIFGTSGGGYLSILTGIYLRGAKVVADNAQLDVRHWIYKDALDNVITLCFDNVGDALKYPERFSVVDAFKKHGYVPKIYLHVNLCSAADNSTQLIPFLKSAEKMRDISEYHDVEVILHFEPTKGHDGISMEDAIAFLYKILGVEEQIIVSVS
jgi:glycosyltransferase involved in cell wall biosynthesis